MAVVKIIRRSIGKGVQGISSLLPGPNKVSVGFPAGEADQDVISRAIYNEFGTSRGIPERPAVRNAVRSKRAENRKAMTVAAKTVIRGAARGASAAMEKRKALSKLGIKVQGDIQAEITSLQTPPNAPSTIRQKGSSNPLIDTGEMRGAVTFKVETRL
jgi:hypothetical protein